MPHSDETFYKMKCGWADDPKVATLARFGPVDAVLARYLFAQMIDYLPARAYRWGGARRGGAAAWAPTARRRCHARGGPSSGPRCVRRTMLLGCRQQCSPSNADRIVSQQCTAHTGLRAVERHQGRGAGQEGAGRKGGPRPMGSPRCWQHWRQQCPPHTSRARAGAYRARARARARGSIIGGNGSFPPRAGARGDGSTIELIRLTQALMRSATGQQVTADDAADICTAVLFGPRCCRPRRVPAHHPGEQAPRPRDAARRRQPHADTAQHHHAVPPMPAHRARRRALPDPGARHQRAPRPGHRHARRQGCTRTAGHPRAPSPARRIGWPRAARRSAGPRPGRRIPRPAAARPAAATRRRRRPLAR